MPLQATSGAASYDAFGGGVPVVPTYIEDIFSCFLYTGNGSTQTITNGIDLSGKGGLVWIKDRTQTWDNLLVDSARGNGNALFSNTTAASTAGFGVDLASNGFNLTSGDNISNKIRPYASWTFRKQPKFFDVVTWSGNSTAGRSIPHNLGSVPGCIIIKSTNNVPDWHVWHRELTSPLKYLTLNNTDPAYSGSAFTTATPPDATSFNLTASGLVNQTGQTYVAYLFAHDAGGFGLSGTDNVISCGSYTGNGSATGPVVTLGYEPQWVMIKNASDVSNWSMIDNMRGWNVIDGAANVALLSANLSSAEVQSQKAKPLSTGFQINDDGSVVNTSGATYIYIAIRRGPMKVPTDGASVFLPSTYTGSNSVNQVINTGFTVDMTWARARNAANSMEDYDRLRGNTVRLSTDLTDAEIGSTALYFDLSNSVSLRAGYNLNYSTLNFIAYNFRRAPSFFDEVCYTGTGSARTVTHNLTVAPEMIICKKRQTGNTSDAWWVYSANVPNPTTNRLILNETFAANINSATPWNSTAPTSSVFSLGTYDGVNETGLTFVSYLFATCAGVSKVGSYTGNGTTQTINCGFTGGARFVLIKRTDATGDWYVYDTARGMTVLTDPYLLLNTNAAESATLGSVTTVSTGFALNSTILAAINVSGGSYIFLAVS